MAKPYIRITLDGPRVEFDPNYPLPHQLPEGIKLASAPKYGICAGGREFGDEVYFDWEIVTEELSDEAYRALLKAGWVLGQGGKKRRRFHLDDPETLVMPQAGARPSLWPPAGFTLVQKSEKAHVDHVKMEGTDARWVFSISAGQYPVAPLLSSGEIWTQGWDIPTCYAIDANLQCWMDGGHGPHLRPVASSALLSEVENPEEVSRLRQILGMKPELPSWVKAAKAAGWTPPSGWDESRYE